MGDVPTATNQTADIVNKAIQGAITDTSSIVELAAEGYFTWLKFPVIKQLFEIFVNFVGQFFYKNFAMLATKIVIDFQINGENSAAKIAIGNLQNAVNKGNQDAIDKASAEFDDAIGRLIHNNGDASNIS